MSQFGRIVTPLFVLFSAGALWLVGGLVRVTKASGEINGGREPVRVPVLWMPRSSDAVHPSTIGAPSRWVTAAAADRRYCRQHAVGQRVQAEHHGQKPQRQARPRQGEQPKVKAPAATPGTQTARPHGRAGRC